MPLYEYQCAHCGETFAKIVRMGSDQSPRCPHCDAPNVKRLVSAPARLSRDCGPSGGT